MGDDLGVSARPVAGRYELKALLGRGGMGSVWRGEDLLLRRPVAVKRVELPLALPPQERATLRERVLREARAAARLSHPRLVTIFDVVEEEGTVHLVQELVDAPTLKQLVQERGPLPSDEVASIGCQLLDGLAAAHAKGVVHRDVKPGNVMVLPDGAVKLTDFGIASLHGDPQLTATGLVVGSPPFMAPEQALGERAGPPADLWSLGATLYFAVEGEQPFGRGETIATLTAVVHDPPRPMVNAGPLAPALTRLLVKDPAERATSDEAARLLDNAPTVVVEQATRRTEVPPTLGPRGQRRLPLAPVAALVAAALVGGLLYAGTRDRDDPPARAAGQADAPTSTTTAAPAAPRAATPSTTAAPRQEAGAGVPAGWASHTDPDTGYSVAHPAGWKVEDGRGNLRDFTDPSTGTYLRVDWTDDPGPSAEQAWRDLEKDFARRHPGYKGIRIEPTTYKGHPAALWEYTYPSGGATLHAYNLGFVIGDDYGFALNFQAREDQWAASQSTWEQLKAGFEPPTRG